MTNIGFTGTRHGMAKPQLNKVRFIMEAITAAEPPTLFHGDCVGADEQAAIIAAELGWLTDASPGPDPARRACHPSTVVRDPRPFLERNRFIVDNADLLIAAPAGREDRRSGTWHTVSYARSRDIPVIVIAPGRWR